MVKRYKFSEQSEEFVLASAFDSEITAKDAEIARLRQGLWDAFRLAGGDTDGDKTPEVLVSDIVPLVLDCIKELREDEDASLRADAERYRWWFSEDEKKHEFLGPYLEGIKEKWTIDQWRAAIDSARIDAAIAQTKEQG